MDIPVFVLVTRAGWIARSILLLLLILSFLTWGIIIGRFFHLSALSRSNRKFLKRYAGISRFGELADLEQEFMKNPLARLGATSVREHNRILDDANAHAKVKDWAFFLQSQFSMVEEHLATTASACMATLDRGLILLAIVSSIAPFLGLLGTVWGIMNSFFEIGRQGSASLPVVAPGIAEALITTIVGLAVALPAVFFYNYLIHRVDRIEDEVGDFREHLVSRLKREILMLLYGTHSDTGAGNPR